MVLPAVDETAPRPEGRRAGWRRHVHRYGGDSRTLALSALVGVAAGVGALVFMWALETCTRLLLVDLGG